MTGWERVGGSPRSPIGSALLQAISCVPPAVYRLIDSIVFVELIVLIA